MCFFKAQKRETVWCEAVPAGYEENPSSVMG